VRDQECFGPLLRAYGTVFGTALRWSYMEIVVHQTKYQTGRSSLIILGEKLSTGIAEHEADLFDNTGDPDIRRLYLYRVDLETDIRAAELGCGHPSCARAGERVKDYNVGTTQSVRFDAPAW